MRTTVNIDDDILRAVKSLAKSENRALGSVVSDLLRRALRPAPYPSSETTDFPRFQIAEGAAPITTEMVRQALDESE